MRASLFDFFLAPLFDGLFRIIAREGHLNSSTIDERGGSACEVGGTKNCIRVQRVTMTTL